MSGYGIDTREVAESLGLKVLDTALPMDWYDDVHARLGVWPQSYGFVWCYDNNSISGYPVPVTVAALVVLRANHWTRTEEDKALYHPELLQRDGETTCRTCLTLRQADQWHVAGAIS